jgi:hypothetical protein
MRGGRDPHISLLMALALRYRPPASPSTLGSPCPVRALLYEDSGARGGEEGGIHTHCFSW